MKFTMEQVPAPRIFRGGLWGIGLVILIGLVNPHLFPWPGQPVPFRWQQVLDGQWWLFISHAFVHVTWFHLLFDVSGFVMLYQMLPGSGHARRILYSVGGIVGGAIWTLLIPGSGVLNHGLCGLSASAHGLMAILGSHWFRRGTERPRKIAGLVTFSIVTVKSVVETFTGDAMLEVLHFGLSGIPIGASHLGGILGALGLYLIVEHCSGM